MTKPLQITKREAEAYATATDFRAWHRNQRTGAPTSEADARKQAEALVNTNGGKALIYAIADLGGLLVDCTVASYDARTGWMEAVVK